jgi:hypothetical protein
VAADAGHLSATSVLCDERLRAPAQLVHSDKATETEIWIGELVRQSTVNSEPTVTVTASTGTNICCIN